MAHYRHKIKNLTRVQMDVDQLDEVLSENCEAFYQPRNHNLFRVYKAPKFKQRLVQKW